MTINSRNKGAGAELEFSNIIYQWSVVLESATGSVSNCLLPPVNNTNQAML